MSDRSAHEIMRAYGCLAPTVAEQRAYIGVLDRMGAFASSERDILRQEGFLRSAAADEERSPAPDHPRPRMAR
jgi:hypothetical protein